MAPDKWLIIKTQEDEYKIFATWSGSYLGSDHWRFSTPIVYVEDRGDYFDFHTLSGSVYGCNKNFYGIAGAYNEACYLYWVKPSKDTEVPENTDWLQLINKESK